MIIKARCPKCDWEGIAKVGKGIHITDYECPMCGHEVKSPRYGRVAWWDDEMAKLKEVKGGNRKC